MIDRHIRRFAGLGLAAAFSLATLAGAAAVELKLGVVTARGSPGLCSPSISPSASAHSPTAR